MEYTISFTKVPTFSNLARSANVANAPAAGPVTVTADTIIFEDGFVKFYCPGSKNLVAAYPQDLITAIEQVVEE